MPLFTMSSSSHNDSTFGAFTWATLTMYALFMVGYLVLHTLTGTRWWPVALLANFAHWLLLPFLILLPMALWVRRWPLTLLSVLGILGFLWHYGPLFMPKASSAHAANDAQPLTAMTYNIQNYRVPPDKLIALIDDVDADIVSVIELSRRQATALETTTYPYKVLYGRGSSGLGLLSRYPILEHELLYLDSQRRPHMRAVLDVNGRSLTVILAHPPSPRLRNFQYRPHPDAASEIAALAELAVREQPAILLGDLNISDQSDAYQAVMAAGLRDSFREVGWGFGATWPTPRLFSRIPLPAFVRIDYIFHTPELQATSARVEHTADASDHLPVVVDLLWP